jgi:hypothetical protein
MSRSIFNLGADVLPASGGAMGGDIDMKGHNVKDVKDLSLIWGDGTTNATIWHGPNGV